MNRSPLDRRVHPTTATIAPGRLTAFLPVHTVSEANMGGRLRARLRRKKLQKEHTHYGLLHAFGYCAIPQTARVVVTLTRHSPRRLDGDNLAGACKVVRDTVAHWLGRDDREGPLLDWQYAQERGALPGVTVTLTWDDNPFFTL